MTAGSYIKVQQDHLFGTIEEVSWVEDCNLRIAQENRPPNGSRRAEERRSTIHIHLTPPNTSELF